MLGDVTISPSTQEQIAFFLTSTSAQPLNAYTFDLVKELEAELNAWSATVKLPPVPPTNGIITGDLIRSVRGVMWWLLNANPPTPGGNNATLASQFVENPTVKLVSEHVPWLIANMSNLRKKNFGPSMPTWVLVAGAAATFYFLKRRG